MSNDQLKWHLLKEVSQLMLKHRRADSSHHLGVLFLSGQGPAQLVRMILSQHLRINPTYHKFYIELVDSNTSLSNSPDYIKTLALRWTRFLEITNEHDKPYSNLPGFALPFLQHNSVEKLQLSFSSLTNNNFIVTSTVRACSNLSILSGSATLLSLVFKRAMGSFSKVHTIEISNYNSNAEKLFSYLTERPYQFPALHTLTVSTHCDLKLLVESFYNNSFPNVKSINLQSATNCCTAIDFSKFNAICKSFPNLENASLTLTSECYDFKVELDRVYEAFETFNCKAVFSLNYKLCNWRDIHVQELGCLESRLASKGTITSCYQVNDFPTYVVTTSYPNKTMTLEMNVCTYGGDIMKDVFSKMLLI